MSKHGLQKIASNASLMLAYGFPISVNLTVLYASSPLRLKLYQD